MDSQDNVERSLALKIKKLEKKNVKTEAPNPVKDMHLGSEIKSLRLGTHKFKNIGTMPALYLETYAGDTFAVYLPITENVKYDKDNKGSE